ncbi:hypothetical protein GNI_083540 [Gregarina niphandrodes]|uniref:Uncharacterized protein n=1 Tax=Gregarina niphandrodes TaxID=110365 RepID=A0A023B657_GRENI|nr:hypothetical protein GNI_083540 [Gregarina niphandrodes]EZG65396.1 hypothetical protein GNI_083540 [Gregarina niphandrodes]|eukprot:XP_011134085.1 hypothetical protein GNI_083540 [Gregarina niphandrodes]
MEVPLEELLKLQQSLKHTPVAGTDANAITDSVDAPRKKELTTVDNKRPQRPSHLVFKNPRAKLSDPREFAKNFVDDHGGTKYSFLHNMQKKEREELGTFIKSDGYRQLNKDERQQVHKKFQQLTSAVNHKSKRVIKLEKKNHEPRTNQPNEKHTHKISREK